jgi:imidazoleglycerol-phosphate dehydratase
MASKKTIKKPEPKLKINKALQKKASLLRVAEIIRETTETQIHLRLNLDGEGKSKIDTGIPFFDHMLVLLAKHSLFDIDLKVNGDIDVDFHHTVEDVGIAIGMAINQALGDRKGIRRYSFGYLPMDETLVKVAIDFSGRPLLVFRCPRGLRLMNLYAGNFPAQLIIEFLRGISQHAAMTLHVHVIETEETHHMLEGIFKGLAKALDFATRRDDRVKGIPSSKGLL